MALVLGNGYAGDISEDATIEVYFNTMNNTSGLLVTISGSILRVYKDGDLTEISSGVSLTPDFDGRPGFHRASIDTSASASFVTGIGYTVVLTGGLVSGTSVAGYMVGSFSIENRINNLTNTKIDTMQTDVTAVKAKTDLRPDGVKKNTALNNFMFTMLSATTKIQLPGLTVTGKVSVDGAAFASLGTVTPIENGWYKINLTAANLNGDTIALEFAAIGADFTNFIIKTET